MSGTKYAGATILFIVLTIQMTRVVNAQTESTGSIVEGVVFEDADNNLIRDEGEPGLSVIPLEFSDGSDRLIQIETGEDGSFLLILEAGLWRVLVQPPSGFETADTSGLEFVIEDETSSLRLDIALTNMGGLESETQDVEPGENNVIIDEETVTPLMMLIIMILDPQGAMTHCKQMMKVRMMVGFISSPNRGATSPHGGSACWVLLHC